MIKISHLFISFIIIGEFWIKFHSAWGIWIVSKKTRFLTDIGGFSKIEKKENKVRISIES